MHSSVDQALAHARTLLLPQPALAERQAAEILQAIPDHPEALLILGIAHRRQGNLHAAKATLEPLARTQPRAAIVHFEWAITQAELGQIQAAIASLRGALMLKPDMPGGWRQMGDLLITQEPAAADAAYGRHVQTAIHDPVLMQAAADLNANKLTEAEHRLRAHLRAHPTDVAALRMLAETGTRLGRYADAETLLAHCLTLMPSFTLARHNYAVVLFRQNKPEAAIPHIEKLLEEDARNPDYRNLLAACLATTGEYALANDVYEKVLADFPNQPKIWLSHGHALKTAGRRAEALHAYRMAAAQAPGMGEAYWSLANMKNETLAAAEIAAIRTQLARADLAVEDRFHLHYALGHVLEQNADYAESWQHYAAGAKLRRGEITYSAERTTAQLDRTRALMTAQFFAEREGAGCTDEAPIFIVGLPRSGSTLIEQILASHSAVEGTMELPELARIARDLGGGSRAEESVYPQILAELDPVQFANLGARFLDRTRVYRKTGRPFFIDKMPNNFVHVGLIHLILPRAKIIDARRHPMAACFSAFKQHFAKGQHYTYDLTELGRYYTDYAALMAHVDQVLPGLVHRVFYEDMVEDTEAETRLLLAYCGLGFEESCLRFYDNDRAVRTASSEQVRRPIFRDGLDHWRNYQPWLGELAVALGFSHGEV